jgi:hypothetical protein
MSALSTSPAFAYATSALLAAGPYLALCACAFSLLALIAITLFERRLSRLLLGRSGSLEETISILSRDMKEMQTFRVELEKYLKQSEMRLRGSVQGVGVVRFNPFKEGNGGNQSFAAAFLDDTGSGVVLSTLYARDRVGVYAKPLVNSTSTYELSAEEKEAVTKAVASIAAHKKH